jgi:hypothetical protein
MTSNMAYFDPLGETEPENTVFKLSVRVLPRPPSKWLPKIVTRTPVTYPKYYTIPRDNTNPNRDYFELKDVEDITKRKIIRIERALFPLDMRCDRVRQDKVCKKGCYILEKRGSICRTKCKRSDCKGHVYNGRVKEDEAGRSCFGKKGQRLVCLATPIEN